MNRFIFLSKCWFKFYYFISKLLSVLRHLCTTPLSTLNYVKGKLNRFIESWFILEKAKRILNRQFAKIGESCRPYSWRLPSRVSPCCSASGCSCDPLWACRTSRPFSPPSRLPSQLRQSSHGRREWARSPLPEKSVLQYKPFIGYPFVPDETYPYKQHYIYSKHNYIYPSQIYLLTLHKSILNPYFIYKWLSYKLYCS